MPEARGYMNRTEWPARYFRPVNRKHGCKISGSFDREIVDHRGDGHDRLVADPHVGTSAHRELTSHLTSDTSPVGVLEPDREFVCLVIRAPRHVKNRSDTEMRYGWERREEQSIPESALDVYLAALDCGVVGKHEPCSENIRLGSCHTHSLARVLQSGQIL